MVSRRLIYKFLLDFVYPNRCPICGGFIKWDELLCKNCECKLPFHKKILCEKCGKDKCLDHDSLHFDSIYTLMRYEEQYISLKMTDSLILRNILRSFWVMC